MSQKKLQAVWSVASLAVAALACARPAQAEVLTLHELLGGANKALTVLIAEADHAAADQDLERERSIKGWKLAGSAGYGRNRDVVDVNRSFKYDALRTKIAVAYPLLGAYSKEQREIEVATGKASEKRVRLNAALKIAELEIEDVYASCWGAQEALEIVDAYLATEKRAGGDDEIAATYRKARSSQRRLMRDRDDAIGRLEELTGRKLAGLVTRAVQLPRIAEVDGERLDHEHPDLAALRALQKSLRAQLDSSVWYGIDGTFEVAQTRIDDMSNEQYGEDLSATLSVTLPLSFRQAGVSEKRALEAQIQSLELQLRQKAQEIMAEARAVHGEHLELFDEVEDATERTQKIGNALKRDPAAASPARLRDYYLMAMREIGARKQYWQSHVALRRFVSAGVSEPAPEPTGPSTTDIGTRLAEPLAKALH